ncbi:MAG: VanW family protein, partial [Ruminococcus sp.]|nr:VanW family protein [Ruminococcus sp.]
MKKELDNGVNSYLIMNQDGFIDISSGPSPDNQNNYIDSGDMNAPMAFATVDEEYDIGNKRMGGQSGGSSKKPIIVAVLALLAATAVGVIGYTAYKHFNEPAEPDGSTLFTYAENSVVSGIDISGKTVSQAKKLLEQNTDKFLTPVTLEVDVNGETTELRENNFTYTYNIEEVLRRMRMDTEFADASVGKKDGSYSITATVTDDSIKKNVEKICEERNCAPKNARVAAFHPYEAKRFEFDGAKWGITVNAKTLNAQIKECFETGNTKTTITADIEKKAADMSMGELEDKLVKLASYETYSTNTANGTSNMRVALESCNGAVIEPGETWSFNESTGDSNKESNGYKSASVILEGKLTEGIGGGICQASSTIYNAAVRANMKIVERYNHKWASGYVPTGLDATIDYPNLDLKLGNATNCQMFIEC